jgi:phenylpropionate dioxygenase-like ring-hydroxylating dioxygenase large terminal subunit
MEAKRQIELVKRALAHVAARTTDADTERGPTTLRAATYLGEERLAREQERLFRSLPLVVAHSSMLASAGDFITHDHGGVPLLVVRGDDGKISAFLNVCRHRGTRVEPLPCGSGKKAFVCPYHSWSYARDGHLLGIPHEEGFSGIDKTARGLVRVPAGEAAGLVFVRASRATSEADAQLDARAFLGPLADDLDGFGLPTSHVYDARTYTKEMNWKLAFDIFLEAYHLRTAHKDSIYPIFFDNIGLVDCIGPHRRTVFPKRSIRELAGQPDAVMGTTLRTHANVLFHIFPNTLVLVQPDHAAIFHAFPDGPTRTRFTSYTAVPEAPLTPKARAHWDANNAILYGATDEDFALGESIQRGLSSGANDDIVFGAFEHALAHFHAEIERRLQGDLDAAPRNTAT